MSQIRVTSRSDGELAFSCGRQVHVAHIDRPRISRLAGCSVGTSAEMTRLLAPVLAPSGPTPTPAVLRNYTPVTEARLRSPNDGYWRRVGQPYLAALATAPDGAGDRELHGDRHVRRRDHDADRDER